MHDGMNWNNDLQRGQSLEKNQHHLMIDGEPSITAFAVANRPKSVHRLGDTDWYSRSSSARACNGFKLVAIPVEFRHPGKDRQGDGEDSDRNRPTAVKVDRVETSRS